jgi:hypothetical protein
MKTKLVTILEEGLRKEFHLANVSIKRDIRIVYNDYILPCVFSEDVFEELLEISTNSNIERDLLDVVVEEVKDARKAIPLKG